MHILYRDNNFFVKEPSDHTTSLINRVTQNTTLLIRHLSLYLQYLGGPITGRTQLTRQIEYELWKRFWALM